MNLHANTADFTALITFTAKHFNIIPAFVEKDYWITLTLSRLSQSENVENAVFKGGTSLSKGYRIISRFLAGKRNNTIATYYRFSSTLELFERHLSVGTSEVGICSCAK